MSQNSVGDISQHVQDWSDIGASSEVINWIKDGVKWDFISLPPHIELSNRQLNQKQSQFVDKELKNLLSNNIISQCDADYPLCISPISCVPKKNDFRLVIDHRELNRYIKCPQVCYEDIRTLRDIVQPGDYMISADIKSGYHHIPVNSHFSRYLGKRWRNQTYVWNRLPFGLNVSAYYFVKTVRAIIAHLRSQNVRALAYVDDFVVCAHREHIDSHCKLLLSTLDKLGLHISKDKSLLDPSQKLQFIGYEISTVENDNRVWIRIPPPRIRKLKHDIQRALKAGQLSARALAALLGNASRWSRQLHLENCWSGIHTGY